MERLVQMHNLFKSGRNYSCADLEQRFERSTATVKRDIQKLRDRFGALISYDRESRTYYLPSEDDVLGRVEIPGLWLHPEEAYGLLTLYNVMTALDPGVLREYIEPLRGVLWRQIGRRVAMKGFDKKIVIEIPALRCPSRQVFSTISRSLIQGEIVQIKYRAQTSNGVQTIRCTVKRLALTGSGWQIDVEARGLKRLERIPLGNVVSAIPKS